MCGISAYNGNRNALEFIVQGLEKLEYRGYDSAGISLLENQQLKTYKCKGRVVDLKERLSHYELNGNIGIGHTRWATHGIPSDINAHPHTNSNETISIVHNGIIENYQELKAFLMAEGYRFISQTDTEVIVHLLDHYDQGNMLETIIRVIPLLKGSYALCIVSTNQPDIIFTVKKESPLILGVSQEGSVGASDIPALLDYTRDVFYLKDQEIALMYKDHIDFYDRQGHPIRKELQHVPFNQEAARKNGYETFMLKEIFEQPQVIARTLRNHIHHHFVYLEELKDLIFDQFNKIYFVACGTAYHACLSGAYIFEKLNHIPCFIETASEFRYKDPLLDEQTLCIFISQSGETADTLAALRLSKTKGACSIGIVNVLGSSLAREVDYVLYTMAGPEIAVASTKAYTSQLVTLVLLAMHASTNDELIDDLYRLPKLMERILEDYPIFEKYAAYLKDKRDCFYIGRLLDYASSLEGALKIKEISYIHADAYIAGELKHGPIALIENGSVVIAIALQSPIIEKTISNIQETMARGAHVILFTVKEHKDKAQEVYLLPNIHPLLQPILVALPLQLVAYYCAKLKGCDVDKPRNLAKSVTVE